MFAKLRQWFESATATKPRTIELRSTADGEELTGDESLWIYATATCPDCGIGELRNGPEGGISRNVACVNCGSEFNIVWLDTCCLGDRISDPGPRDIGDRKMFYGLE